MKLVLLASVLPVLYWTGPPDTAPTLKQAGIHDIATAAGSGAWAAEPGFTVQTVDLDKTVKLPAPGVNYHMNDASASRVPWVNSNGWQYLRQPGAQFSYETKGKTAALAAAEAYVFGSAAFIQTDEVGLLPLASALKFLHGLDQRPEPALADIGFVDDGSPLDAEVMNLLVRENLLFKRVRMPETDLKLTVRLGAEGYTSKDPNVLEHQIRADLSDEKRLIRIYGTSVVVAHVTGDSGKMRIHLLNYGAPRGTMVGAFRIRVLGFFDRAEMYSFEKPAAALMDFSPDRDATEFTVPGLTTYAVVDLTRTRKETVRQQ